MRAVLEHVDNQFDVTAERFAVSHHLIGLLALDADVDLRHSAKVKVVEVNLAVELLRAATFARSLALVEIKQRRVSV